MITQIGFLVMLFASVKVGNARFDWTHALVALGMVCCIACFWWLWIDAGRINPDCSNPNSNKTRRK